MTRRSFFEQVPTGVYGAALTYMLGRDVFGGSGLLAAGSPPTTAGTGPRVYDLKPRAAHFEPQAKSVILLFQNGGPSQMDLFDPKPALDKHHGETYLHKLHPEEITDPHQARGILRSPFKFV